MINQSYATGTVTGDGSTGGLVGYAVCSPCEGLSIQNSYATGAVMGVGSGASLGGLLGTTQDVTVSHSYSAGLVQGTAFNIGGLVGKNDSVVNPVNDHSYWDTQSSNQSTSALGTGLTTSIFQNGTLPTGFDPSVWSATAGQYPTLLGLAGQGTLISLQSINPPSANNTIPINTFPSGSSLFSNIPSFLSANASNLPPVAATYLTNQVNNAQSFLSQNDVKNALGAGAAALQASADVLSVVSLSSSPFSQAGGVLFRDVGLASLSTVSQAVGVGYNLPSTSSPANALASFALLSADFALTAITCASSDGALCVAGITASLLNDFIVPGIVNIAHDPPDPNYTQVFALPSSIEGVIFNTGDAALDAAADKTVRDLELAAVYVLGADASLNRYSSALAASDQTSAVLQLEAILTYLNLYNAALSNANGDLNDLIMLPDLQSFLNTPYDPVFFESFLQALLASGWSSDDLSNFQALGLDPSLLSQELLDYQVPNFTGMVRG